MCVLVMQGKGPEKSQRHPQLFIPSSSSFPNISEGFSEEVDDLQAVLVARLLMSIQDKISENADFSAFPHLVTSFRS